MRLQESVDQLRFYLNEEGNRPTGTVNTVRTSDTRIAATMVRAMLEYLRTNPQAVDEDYPLAEGQDIAAAIIEFREANADGTLVKAQTNLPVHDSFVPEIESRALALLNLRDQQGYRPDLIRLLHEMTRDSRAS